MADNRETARALTVAQMEFIQRTLPLAMNRAGELGLLKTLHALHEAVRVSGYEMADITARAIKEPVDG